MRGRTKPPASAGGVPTGGKRKQRPRRPIVVGGARRFVERQAEGRGLRQKILLRYGRNGRFHGIQQNVEFYFTHRALRVRERIVSKLFCFRIEPIDRILSIRPSRQLWFPTPLFPAPEPKPGPPN